jgi:hypothetical protein
MSSSAADQSVQAWARAAEHSPGGRARLRDLQRGRVGGVRTKEKVAETLAAYRLAHPGCVTTGRPEGGGPETTWIHAPASSTLTGRYCHTFRDEDGVRLIERQGRVLDEVQSGLHLVQWYSFLDGDETDQQLVRIEDMLDWKFYADEDQWHTAWDNSPRPKVNAR